jgi:outer membrane protein TolC
VYYPAAIAMHRPIDLPRSAFRVCARLSLMLGAAALVGCATFSADGGFGPVAATTRAELGKDVRWPRTAEEHAKSRAEIAALLDHPLGVDDAVQIALLNNHALQADFEELGISEADLVQAGRLPNPRFTLRHATGGGAVDVEETLTFGVLALITTPYAHATGRLAFVQAQREAVLRVVRLADRTRTAYFTALAAHDSLDFAWSVKNAAEVGAELAHRMLGAGNWNRLDQIRQKKFYLQALQDLAEAELADARARAELAGLMDVDEARTPVRLAERLPELPTNITALPDLDTIALSKRIDLTMMRAELDELARRLTLTQATRFINVLDAGPARVREGPHDAPAETGYEVDLEIPIFDPGDARVHRAAALYARAADRFAQAAIDARSEVRKAAEQYRVSYEMAVREHEDVLPLQKQITQQDVLRYNASLISVFELLADARAQIAGVNDYIQSVRDFWIAQSHLNTAMLAGASSW